MLIDRIDYREKHQFQTVNTSSHLRLSEIASLREVLLCWDELRRAEPAFRFLCTLDDVDQCHYTSMHASQDERIRLDYPDDPDFDDPEFMHAWEGRTLAHVAAQLSDPEQQLSWKDVSGTLATFDEDIDVLVAMNGDPDAVLDEVVYVQRLPVISDDLSLAGLPNGYFSCDWNVFQNHAVIRHLRDRYGYRFFGIGASWLGFVRELPLQARDAEQLMADLSRLHGQTGCGRAKDAWRSLGQIVQRQDVLLLGYAEYFKESFAGS